MSTITEELKSTATLTVTNTKTGTVKEVKMPTAIVGVVAGGLLGLILIGGKTVIDNMMK